MDTYLVSLRIVGQSLDTDGVTTELGLAPTDVRRFGKPARNEILWEYEFGSLEWPKQWDSAEEGLKALLEVLQPLRERLVAYQQQHKVYFHCGYCSVDFAGGPWFSPALLKAVGEFGIPVEIGCIPLDQPD